MKLGRWSNGFLILIAFGLLLSWWVVWGYEPFRVLPIGSHVLKAPKSMLWFAPKLVGDSPWTSEDDESARKSSKGLYGDISFQGCWVLGKGIMARRKNPLDEEGCKKYGGVTAVIRFGIEPTPIGWAPLGIERMAHGRLKEKLTWGYPDGLEYKGWFSEWLGVKFMRLMDKNSVVNNSSEHWNNAFIFDRGELTRCPIFAVNRRRGRCESKFSWGNDISVTANYDVRMIKYRDYISKDILGFLDEISSN